MYRMDLEHRQERYVRFISWLVEKQAQREDVMTGHFQINNISHKTHEWYNLRKKVCDISLVNILTSLWETSTEAEVMVRKSLFI